MKKAPAYCRSLRTKRTPGVLSPWPSYLIAALRAFVFNCRLAYPGHYRAGEGYIARYLGDHRRQQHRQSHDGRADRRQQKANGTDLLEKKAAWAP